MNRSEAIDLLQARAALTSQPYGEAAIVAWRDALAGRSYEACRAALMTAAQTHAAVSVAHIFANLPAVTSPSAPPSARCELCDGTGWVDVSRERAHRPETCLATVTNGERPCACGRVEPCLCSRGAQIAAQQIARRMGS